VSKTDPRAAFEAAEALTPGMQAVIKDGEGHPNSVRALEHKGMVERRAGRIWLTRAGRLAQVMLREGED
jgi:hypothetical protein